MPARVTDSSALIVFQRIERLALLAEILGPVLVPGAVRREVFGRQQLPEWIEERPVGQPLASQIVSVRLGPGEREAIPLALEINARELVLDDLPARRLAQSLGLPVIGSVGLLLRAKRHGTVPAIRPLLEAMHAQGFRLSARLWAGILSVAGEE